MKKSKEIYIEKTIGKYIYSEKLSLFKSKSKSRSLTTSIDSHKSNHIEKCKKHRKSSDDKTPKIFFPFIKDKKGLFSIKTKSDLLKSPFLSNFKENHIFSMKLTNNESKLGPSLFETDINSNSFVKVRGKITVNNSVSEFTETDINTNIFDIKSDFIKKNNKNNFFNNTFLNNEIYDTFLNSISGSSSNSNSSSNINNLKNKNNAEKKVSKTDYKDINNIDSLNSINNNLSDKEKVVIGALIELNKYNFTKREEEIDVFEFDLEEYYFNKKYKNIISSYSSEEDLEFEKNVYEFVDNRIKLYYKTFKNTKPHNLEEKKNDIKKFNNEIKKILMYEKKIPNLSCIGFKSIVMSLFSLIIDLLSNSSIIHFKKISLEEEEKISFENNKNYLVFIDLITKYNKIKEICPYIEKDFTEIIDNFQNEKKMKISLSNLFTDLYWDHVFKNHSISYKFTNGYIYNNFKKNISNEESKNAMDKIIDILINCEIPYKKNIGELLSLPYMNKENVFLMDLINKSKKTVNPFEIKNPFIIQKDKNLETEKNNNDKKINDNDNEKETVKEKKIEENKNTENFTLDEVYKYIVGDSKNENKKHKKKNKNRKKKKKNKNEEIKITEEVDPVVEEFIQYFIEYQQDYVPQTKIKPVISEEWIKSIS
jgi:hypothetical protein